MKPFGARARPVRGSESVNAEPASRCRHCDPSRTRRTSSSQAAIAFRLRPAPLDAPRGHPLKLGCRISRHYRSTVFEQPSMLIALPEVVRDDRLLNRHLLPLGSALPAPWGATGAAAGAGGDRAEPLGSRRARWQATRKCARYSSDHRLVASAYFGYREGRWDAGRLADENENRRPRGPSGRR